eukprot:CAMPEP_0196578020 /NCGR_PEP_ID=MMETSP1081-20130531/6998_1 /TAXON_ID=36882 /ORGANISM="Pyramimonas amylifera, Strain CCMP720" /LENGTH=170 /DNA_ID=CAMNT_0041897113 /DNA_START=178 /DNA_END=690 /DNA_ORIENTATION=+
MSRALIYNILYAFSSNRSTVPHNIYRPFSLLTGGRPFANTPSDAAEVREVDEASNWKYSETIKDYKLNVPLNHRRKDEKTLLRLLSHPLNMNVRWKDVEHLFQEGLGGKVEPWHPNKTNKHKGLRVQLKGETHVFHGTDGNGVINQKSDIVVIRHMLERAGILLKEDVKR